MKHYQLDHKIKFLVKEEDIKEFREKIYPYWKGKSMEDVIKNNYGKEIKAMAKVVKINQKDHAQGHICPDSCIMVKTWTTRIDGKS